MQGIFLVLIMGNKNGFNMPLSVPCTDHFKYLLYTSLEDPGKIVQLATEVTFENETL